MLESGRIIDGRYTLRHRLDKGGMGEVWLASESGARDVALKFILAGGHDAGLVQRFLAEVHTAASLRSPHVVVVYAWGQHEDSPYMAMELLRGSNLADQLRAKGRIRDVGVAVDYVVQACEAVAVAHAQGVIHRDLKPANLFLDEPTRQIKVLDFGVAKATQSTRAQLTRDGVYMGTVAYSSPEQLANAAEVTPRSDIWSIGAILYELLAGVPAFPQVHPEVIAAITQREPRPLLELRSDVPEGVAACVARCLAKQPERRFPDVEALIRALAEFGGRQSLAILARQQTEAGPPSAETTGDGSPPFHSEQDLEDAVFSTRLDPDGNPRRVIFMLGAGFSMPAARRRGVPGTNEVVNLIQKQLRPRERAQLAQRLEVSRNRYQDAFELLASTHSTDVANSVVREAVLRAYQRPYRLPTSSLEQQKRCREYEETLEAWEMPPGVEQLGRIIAAGMDPAQTDPSARACWGRFSQLHLTTNFDPLLAVSIRRHRGTCIPFVIDKDFPCPEPQPGFCTLVHLHGRWNKGDTLHNSLAASREQLERSLGEQLERSVLVVVGYGGWDDVFMRTLERVARSRGELDVMWSFFENDPLEIWQQQREIFTRLAHLGPRIKFYRGVDSNRFFERLATRLSQFSQKPAPGPLDESTSTDAPHDLGVRPSRRAHGQRWALAGAIGALALVGVSLGAWHFARSATPPHEPPAAAPDRSTPTPALAPVPSFSEPLPINTGTIRIQCDAPQPPGAIRVGDQRIEISDFCPSSTQAAAEHGRDLSSHYPLLLKGTAKLESDHPFYELKIDLGTAPIAFHIEKQQRTTATLRLKGKGCDAITRARVVFLDPADLAAPIEVQPRRVIGSSSETCEATLQLPLEAYHAALGLRLTPPSYVASNARFDAVIIETAIALRTPGTGPKAKAKSPPPAASKLSEDCVPPKYCPL